MMKSLIYNKTMRLVTYGCGVRYEPAKFQPVKNRQHVKAAGGLWASPVGCGWGWKEWCESEQCGDLSTSFEFVYHGRTLIIDQKNDLRCLPWQDAPGALRGLVNWPDYEVIQAAGVDAVYLTENGQEETRFSNPSLYGWDCECVFVMNPETIQPLPADRSCGSAAPDLRR